MVKLPKYYLRFENKGYMFTKPLAVIHDCDYNTIQYHLRQGRWIAGYFGYENNSAHLGVFAAPAKLTSLPLLSGTSHYKIDHLKFNYTPQEYYQKIKHIKQYIRQGETYQLNFTGKFTFTFQGDALSLYQELKQQQPVPYAAFCKLDHEYIISLSPELFFEQCDNTIMTKPMKGTSARGYNVHTDAIRARQLKTSKKQTAENVMIVDLLRNDLHKICESGSVTVPKLFTVERYRTLLQLTSTIQGQLKPNIHFKDIMDAIFPGGSITGAPKLRTRQLIRELETEPRGVYCGALGFIGPHEAQFSIPIRTLSITGKRGEMGVGSGITYDSNAKHEYQECALKARFLTHRTKSFQLIETMLWDKQYLLLREHLHRLQQSAKYFDYPVNLSMIKKQLRHYTKQFLDNHAYIIRILLHQNGAVHITHHSRDAAHHSSGRVLFSKYHTNSTDVFLYHKTTNRTLYDKEYTRYTKLGYVDVVFCNEHGNVTEGAISNIIIKKNNTYYTPPVSCGLLPGVFRTHFMKTHSVTEKILIPADVHNADEVYMCNSVRGLTRVKTVHTMH